MSTVNVPNTVSILNVDWNGTNFICDYPNSGTPYTVPLTILCSAALTVNFSTSSVINSANAYIILGSSDITFDGQNNDINVSTVIDYPGLLQITGGFSNITVKNVNIVKTTPFPVLAQSAGWVCQQNCTGASFINCHSDGDISKYGGGIVGANSNNVICTNCSSSGEIGEGVSPSESGGIVGKSAGNVTCTNCSSSGFIHEGGGGIVGAFSFNANCSCCSSTGSIDASAGGIVGAGANSSQSNATTIITDCYSTGSIAVGGGGIIGFGTNKQSTACSCTITGCFSIGNIGGGAGGIYGSTTNDYTSSSFCYAYDCYSIGDIDSTAGGIYGTMCKLCVAEHCYSVGSITSSGGGGIYGSDAVDSTATRCYTLGNLSTGAGSLFGTVTVATNSCINCYVRYGNSTEFIVGDIGNFTNCQTENGGPWNDTNANAVLKLGSLNNNWISVAVNTPYLLAYYTNWSCASPAGYIEKIYTSFDNQWLVRGYYVTNPGLNYPTTGLIFGYTIFTVGTTLTTTGVVTLTFSDNYIYGNNIIYNLPLTIENSDPVNQPLIVNCNLQNQTSNVTTNYFILNTDHITFDCKNTSLNINVANYPGIVRKTGTFSNINIQNIIINSQPSGSLFPGNGWIGGQTGWYGGNFINCRSNGNVPENGGGIVGSFASNTTCSNCISNGTLGTGAGGLFGANSQNNNANVCFFSGPISGTFSGATSLINCFEKIVTPEGYPAFNLLVDY